MEWDKSDPIKPTHANLPSQRTHRSRPQSWAVPSSIAAVFPVLATSLHAVWREVQGAPSHHFLSYQDTKVKHKSVVEHIFWGEGLIPRLAFNSLNGIIICFIVSRLEIARALFETEPFKCPTIFDFSFYMKLNWTKEALSVFPKKMNWRWRCCRVAHALITSEVMW